MASNTWRGGGGGSVGALCSPSAREVGSAGPRAPCTVWARSDAVLCTVSAVAARLRNVLTCSECAAEAVLDLSVSSAERGG